MSARSVKPVWRQRIRRIALASLRPLDAVAQRVVRPKPGRVCYASEPDYSDNARAVYRHLLDTRDAIEHLWLLRDMGNAETVRADFAARGATGHRLMIKPWGLRSYPAFLRARCSFHTHGLFSFSPPSGGRVSVSLWHGMPVKAIRRLHGGNRVLFPVRGTYHVATSSFFRFIIASAFGVDPGRVLVSGLPRTDVLKGLTAPEHDRGAIADALGLPADRPWVLWMPTHRSEPDFRGSKPARSFIEATDPELVRALDEACRAAGAHLIVKLHPLDTLNDREVPLPYPSILVLSAPKWQASGIQLYDLIAASDGLITDVSSVFIDYLHTGRPIGVLGYDSSTYTRETIFDPRLLLRCAAATEIDSVAEVERFVARAVSGESAPRDPHDAAGILNEDHDVASCEHVVRAAGL